MEGREGGRPDARGWRLAQDPQATGVPGGTHLALSTMACARSSVAWSCATGSLACGVAGGESVDASGRGKESAPFFLSSSAVQAGSTQRGRLAVCRVRAGSGTEACRGSSSLAHTECCSARLPQLRVLLGRLLENLLQCAADEFGRVLLLLVHGLHLLCCAFAACKSQESDLAVRVSLQKRFPSLQAAFRRLCARRGMWQPRRTRRPPPPLHDTPTSVGNYPPSSHSSIQRPIHS